MTEPAATQSESGNPYDPPSMAMDPAPLSRLAIVWNVILAGLFAGLLVMAMFAVTHLYRRWLSGAASGWKDIEIFCRIVSQMIVLVSTLGLCLLTMSTYAFQRRRPLAWRLLAGFLVIMSAFDYYSLAFTGSSVLRACILAVPLSSLILFGGGWTELLLRFRRPRAIES